MQLGEIGVIRPPNYWRRESDILWPPKSDHRAATAWLHSLAGLYVLRSVSTLNDGSKWLHISVTRRDRIPTWTEMMKVRDDFLGDDVEAYMVAPKKEDYANLHQFCLHWWAPVDGLRKVANLQDLQVEDAI